jgi:hypothetical protein
MKIHGKLARFSFVFALNLCVFANATNLFFWTLPAVKDSYRLIMGMERHFELPFKAV